MPETYASSFTRMPLTGFVAIPAPPPEPFTPALPRLRLEGTTGDDLLWGGPGDDWLSGGPGNDVFLPGPGMDLLLGGSGRDVVVVGLMRAEAPVDFHFHRISGPGGDDTFFEMERLDYRDGDWVLDAFAPAARVDMLYRALLHRPADPTGLITWTAELEAGMSLEGLAERIFRSDEYIARFGAPDHAAAEAAIALSPALAAPIWLPDAEAVLVARFYHLALGRAPDREGLLFWTDALERGEAAIDVAGQFLQAPEARAKAAFVDGAGLLAAAGALSSILALAGATYPGIAVQAADWAL